MKTSHATTNMAICILAEMSAYCNAYSTRQMKPYRAAIIQHNARNYIIANQVSGEQPQIHTANIHIFKSASI